MSRRPQVTNLVRPAVIFKLMSRVIALQKRNLVRGYASRELCVSSEIEAIRRDNSLQDIMTIGSLLKGSDGLLGGNKKNLVQICSSSLDLARWAGRMRSDTLPVT
jgi:hypothetical protein